MKHFWLRLVGPKYGQDGAEYDGTMSLSESSWIAHHKSDRGSRLNSIVFSRLRIVIVQ